MKHLLLVLSLWSHQPLLTLVLSNLLKAIGIVEWHVLSITGWIALWHLVRSLLIVHFSLLIFNINSEFNLMANTLKVAEMRR